MSENVCPECGSKRLYKAGLRYLKSGEAVQRWLCRECGIRFTQPPKLNSATKLKNKPINCPSAYTSTRRVCELLQESKNLTENTQQQTAQREGTNLDDFDQRGRMRARMGTKESQLR